MEWWIKPLQSTFLDLTNSPFQDFPPLAQKFFFQIIAAHKRFLFLFSPKIQEHSIKKNFKVAVLCTELLVDSWRMWNLWSELKNHRAKVMIQPAPFGPISISLEIDFYHVFFMSDFFIEYKWVFSELCDLSRILFYH